MKSGILWIKIFRMNNLVSLIITGLILFLVIISLTKIITYAPELNITNITKDGTSPSTTTTKTTITVTTTPTTSTTTKIKPACFMNSDCGVIHDEYVCKVEVKTPGEVLEFGRPAVYRVRRIPICINPGTPMARCDILRSEIRVDLCKEGEKCVPGEPECVKE